MSRFIVSDLAVADVVMLSGFVVSDVEFMGRYIVGSCT
jgi:hypothetical protein